MSIDYNEVAADALALLEDTGRSFTMRVQNVGVYDADKGKASAAPVDFPATGVLLSYPSNRIQSDGRNEPGTSILATDKKLLVSPVGLVVRPKPGDIAIWGCDNYSVIAVKAVEPAGVPVLFELHVRK